MTNQLTEIRRCAKCGAMIEVLEQCTCSEDCCKYTCCGTEMQVMKENTTDGALEKHVPVIEPCGNGIMVKVGELAHPMIEEHYIVWIEVVCGTLSMRRKLRPGEPPEAFFEIPYNTNIIAREYCNKHGVWKSK